MIMKFQWRSIPKWVQVSHRVLAAWIGGPVKVVRMYPPRG